MRSVKVLSAWSFTEPQLEKVRSVSPQIVVEQRPCAADAEVAAALTADTEVLYTLHASFDLGACRNLKWVQLHSAGADQLMGTPLMGSDVMVTTTSGIHAPRLAEYVFASILAFTYRVPAMIEYQRRVEWPADWRRIFVRPELRGRTLGIVGYGSIGREVARLGKAFGMRIYVCERCTECVSDDGYRLEGVGDPEGILPDGMWSSENVREMLADCDFVVLAAPHTPATHHLIDERALRAMRPHAYLVNVGRGGLIDEPALVRALTEGWIAGAGLDVFAQEPLPADSPLWRLDNVLMSPHVGGSTPAYLDRAAELFAANLRRYLAGEPLINLVNKQVGF